MDLETYRQSHKMTKRGLAKFLQISETNLSNYLKGTRIPSLKIGRQIEIRTKNEVRIDDLLNIKRRHDTAGNPQ